MSEIDLNRYLRTAVRWLWLFILSAIIAGGAAYRTSQFLPRTYLTYTTLMVGDNAANPNVTADEIATSERLAAAYADMADREPVLDATIQALRLPTVWWELQKRVLVTRDGSQFIEIRVTDTDPARAKATADEIAHQLILQSPTAASEQELEQRRQFIKQQLDQLQANILQGEKELAAKQAQADKETSARAVLELQDEIKALDLKITSWRSTYASLLTTYNGKPANTLTVISPAFLPTQPATPNLRTNVAAGALAGALLALVAVLIIEYFNDTLAAVDDVLRAVSLPVLGAIAPIRWRRRPAGKLVAARLPHTPIAEAFRILRTNLQIELAAAAPSVILVTSPGLGEGKSLISANLAVSFAQTGRRTILVDLDLRHPSIHTYFEVSQEPGLAPVLDGEPGEELRQRVEAALVPTAIDGLHVLPAGRAPASPAEILASPALDAMLGCLQQLADVVIIDSPPVLPVADATILATREVSVVLVAQIGRTRAGLLQAAVEMLAHAHARILGIVVNKAARSSTAYYRYPPTSPGGRWTPAPLLPRSASDGRLPGDVPHQGIRQDEPWFS
jgi:capsular exopolysaccharide synthesis family protein